MFGFDCNNIKAISYKDYVKLKIPFKHLSTKTIPVKVGHLITIRLHNKKVTLKDDLSDKNYTEYNYSAFDNNRHWLLIKETTYNEEQYLLFNLKTSHIDTLLGLPIIIYDNLLCLQGAATDSKQIIQLWKIIGDQIALTKELSVTNCDISPDEVGYTIENEILIRDSQKRYWLVTNF
jgi:hypothetical protein